MLAVAPFVILFLSAIVAVALTYDQKKNYKVAVSGFIVTIVANSLLLISIEDTITYNSLYVTRSSLLLVEVILVALFTVFLSIKQDLKHTKINQYIYSNFLLFSSAVVGTFLTENLLIISVFYLLSIVFVGALFTYGDYQKRVKSMRNFFIAFILVTILLIVVNLLVNMFFDTLVLSEISSNFTSKSLSVQVFTVVGFLLGFGAFSGIGPVAHYHLENYFQESNQINLKLTTSILMPLSGFITLRTTGFAVQDGGVFAQLYYFFGIVGFLVMGIQCLRELFGMFKKRTRSIPVIVGYYSMAEYNVFLLLGSLKGFGASGSADASAFSTLILQFTILSIFGKFFLLGGLNPVLNSTKRWDLDELGGFQSKFPKFIGFMFLMSVIYLFPKLIGNNLIFNTLSITSQTSRELPIQSALNWTVGFFLILYLLLTIIVNGTFLSEVFFGKEEQQHYGDLINEMKRNIRPYYAIPVVALIVIIIFSIGIPSMGTQYLIA